MKHASGKDYDPSAWAKQRQERIKRALQLRHKRRSGSPDESHTFKPQLIASTDGAVSKLPMGARTRDAVGATRGQYDLTVLDGMENAFPPRRTSSNIFRENRHDKDTARGMGGTRDSLDRLAVSTSDTQKLSRIGSASSHPGVSCFDDDNNLRRPPCNGSYQSHQHYVETPRTLGANRRCQEMNPGDRWTGPMQERRKEASCNTTDDQEGRRGHRGRNSAVRTNGASEDALSYEVDQRPNVRGSLGEAMPRAGWPGGNAHSIDSTAGPGAREDRQGARVNVPSRLDHGPRREGVEDGGDEGGLGGRSMSIPYGKDDYEAGNPSREDAAFLASLRGGEERLEAADVNVGKGVTNITTASSGDRKRPAQRDKARRPDWDSDTAAVASLGSGGSQTVPGADKSPAAVQGRAEARRKGTDGVLVDSPYAASNGMSKSVDTNGTIKTHSAAWEHKQTKTLPWDGGGAVGIATAAAEGAPKMSAGVCGTGRGVAGRSDGAAAGVRGVLGDESIGGRREGYRLQIMPTSTYKNPDTRGDGESRADGNGYGDDYGDRMDSFGDELPTEKKQLRQNLSLLKKKMNSQAGSRRSQSAGPPRTGDISGDPDAPNGTGYIDPRQPGRYPLHMTTGTAPAMMPAQAGAFQRDDLTARRRVGAGGRGAGGGGRTRPMQEGPGSPYAVNPNPRNAGGPRNGLRSDHDRNPPHQKQRDQYHQQWERAAAATGSRSGRSHREIRLTSDAAHGDDGSDTVHTQPDLGCDRGTHPSYAGGGGDGDRHPPSGRRRAWDGRQGNSGRDGGNSRGDDGDGDGDDDGDDKTDGRRDGGNNTSYRNKGGKHHAHQQELGSRRAGEERGRSTGRGKGQMDGDSEFIFAAELPDGALPDGDVKFEECRSCGRKFKAEALERHARACESVFQAKRKVFNASAMRIKGTELENFAGKGGRASGRGRGRRGSGSAQAGPKRWEDTPVGVKSNGGKSSKWRQQSSQFREAIRQSRVVSNAQKSGRSLADLPPPKPSIPDPSFVPCPHCGRRFNETAGERHIQHCKNIKAKPSVLKKGSGSLLGHASRKPNGGVVRRGQRW